MAAASFSRDPDLRKLEKLITVRVQGIAPGDYGEKAVALSDFFIHNYTQGDRLPVVTILPSCDPRERRLIALLDFDTGKLPRVLERLAKDRYGRETYVVDGQRLSFDVHFHGFTTICDVPPPGLAVADVIAVSGIGSHAFGSWVTEHSEMWLRDFLGKDVPHFRTMIYGYNARIDGHAGGTLEEYAQQFLEDLKDVRSTADVGEPFTQRRPLFFVTHSFGGILVMRALVKAKQAQEYGDPAIATLYKATYGLMFLAVPHGGIDFRNIAAELEKKNHLLVSLLRDINTDSNLLKVLSQEFKNLIQQRRIVSFVEGNAEPTFQMNWAGKWERSGPPRRMLESNSSLLSLPDSTETQVMSFDKGHSSIAKLGPFDTEYKAALRYFREWEQKAPVQVLNQFSKPERGPGPSHNIPYEKDCRFVNRDDILTAIEKAHAPVGHRRAGLFGIGGIGKSQIAIEYAHRFVQGAPNAWVFWVRAGDKTLFERSYLDMSKLQTGSEVEKDEDVFVKVSDWLSDPRNGWWLMVLDNADDFDVFYETQSVRSTWGRESRFYEKPLIDFIPQVGHGKVLVTSRDRGCARRLVDDDKNLIKVDPMTREQSQWLFRSRIPGSSLDTPCSTGEYSLLSILHCIPLAISQAGAYIGNCEISTEEYVKMLEKDERSIIEMLQQDAGDMRREQALSDLLIDEEERSRHAVLHTWRISFRRMEKRDPETARLFSLMAMFHYEDIPKFLLQEEGKEADLEVLLEPLLDLGLATMNLDKHIDIHRLVHLGIRDWLALKGTFVSFGISAIERMVERFPDGSVYENWTKCLQLYRHAHEVMSIQQDRMLCGLTYGKMLNSMGQYYSSRGHVCWAALYAKGALDIKKQILEEYDVEILKSKKLLAGIAGQLGRYRNAEELQLEVFYTIRARIQDETYRKLFPDIASDLTYSYLSPGYYETAENLASTLKSLCERIYGPKSPKTISAAALLARAYQGAGRWKEAEEILLSIIDAQRAQPADHPHIFITLSSLARAIACRQRYPEAEEIYKEALVGCERTLNMNHIHTVTCLAGYSTVLLDMGKDEESEAACNEVLERNKFLGLPSWHDVVLATKSNLSTILAHREEWKEAEETIRAIIKEKEEHWEAQHPSILISRVKLAILYNNKGDLKESQIQLRALLKEEALYKRASHYLVLDAKMQLAIVVSNQGKFRKAIKMGREIEEAYLKRYGPEDKLTKDAGEKWRKWAECQKSIPFWPWPK